MVQRVATVAFEGIEVRPVDVQVQVAPGMPAFTIVGLPDKAVSEARERVRSATPVKRSAVRQVFRNSRRRCSIHCVIRSKPAKSPSPAPIIASLSGAFHAGRSDESVPLRLRR